MSDVNNAKSEALDETLPEEFPQPGPPGDPRMGQFVRPGDGGMDEEGDEVAMLFDDNVRDFGADTEEVVPAEEAAMHLTDPPDMHDSDGYLD